MHTDVRAARDGDIAAIAAIYNEGILDRCATFETRPRTAYDIATMLLRADTGQRPFLVATRAQRVIGFALAQEYNPRACYAGVDEATVYVARRARGRRVGWRLLDALVQACEARGHWKLIGRIFAENEASRRLCARLGFREVGIHERHGQLDGAWRDCVLVERLIGAARRP